MIDAKIAPGIEPIVPSTITAKAGRSRVNAVVGLNKTVMAKTAPPVPEMPADRNALVICILSTLIPLLAARSGLSATALMRIPRRVFVSSR